MKITIEDRQLKEMSRRKWSPTRYCFSFYMRVDDDNVTYITGFGRTPEKAIKDAFSYRLAWRLQEIMLERFEKHTLSFFGKEPNATN